MTSDAMLYRLAVMLGTTPAELRERLTIQELTAWLAWISASR